jgi:hypothetical protein
MQALEADVKGLREQTVKNQASLNELRVQLHKAEGERYANGLVYSLLVLLALALAGAGYPVAALAQCCFQWPGLVAPGRNGGR